MSTAGLLNTRTSTLLELIGNGMTYRVPPYQRDYSWTEEQWEELWDDLMALRTSPDSRHYMGALVLEAKSDRESVIIDGQQRLATLSVLALAVIKQLLGLADQGVDAENNRARAAELRQRFVGARDPASLVEHAKLHLNETDNAFFQDRLVQLREPLNPRGLPRSNKLLWDCFRYFTARLRALAELQNDGIALARLLAETAARQLLFIVVSVDDDLNAYTVFETLNARGLELSATDLLKNYLFSRARTPADLEALQRRWRALLSTVAQESFPEFLRYHLLCDDLKVSHQRLFKTVTERVRTPEEVFALMDALERRAELFAALSDPFHGYWAERPDCRPFVRELNLFRVRQMTPLLFTAYERFDAAGFQSVLRLTSVVAFRHTVIGARNPSEAERIYPRAAKAVADGSARTASDVFELARPLYVTDDRFQQDFATFDFPASGARHKLARYVLARLETDASSRAVDPDTDPGTVEHVLPENPSDGWRAAFPEDKWKTFVYRLGNLTLLERPINKAIGNTDYATKLGAYPRSAYTLTRRLAERFPAEWTPEHINARQLELAVRATHLWRLDFADAG